jgi:hypothetical protein
MPQDCKLIRQAFFEKVLTIEGFSLTHRFVAWADKLDSEYGKGKIRSIWNPNEDKEREYNLVLSLASNGKHYPLIDWDRSERPPKDENLGLIADDKTIWFRSGSGNWHGYINHFSGSLRTTILVAQHPRIKDEGTDNEFARHVERAGYATLRPPWQPKGGNLASSLFLPDGIPEGFLDGLTPPEPERNAWEELFND